MDLRMLSLRTLQTQLSMHTGSVRKPNIDEVEAGAHLLMTIEQDPHRRWGGRKLQEKLANTDVHVNRLV